jgi:hypothetical protein
VLIYGFTEFGHGMRFKCVCSYSDCAWVGCVMFSYKLTIISNSVLDNYFPQIEDEK